MLIMHVLQMQVLSEEAPAQSAAGLAGLEVFVDMLLLVTEAQASAAPAPAGPAGEPKDAPAPAAAAATANGPADATPAAQPPAAVGGATPMEVEETAAQVKQGIIVFDVYVC